MSDIPVYRSLQEHLDGQAVGFPATKTGAEIRFLQKLFTPEEARLALSLSYKPAAIEEITGAAPANPAEEPGRTLALLESMVLKGAIGWKEKDGRGRWFLLPMVVGMYEGQDGHITPEIQAAADDYFGTREWGTALLAAAPSQMRTIPVGIDVPVHHHVASYEQIRAIVDAASGPFVVIPCICRESAASKGKSCGKTMRTETCLGFGETAAAVLRRKHGRQISREEVIAILRENEKDGLVLQPSNARNPVFVCSCCGCCCGMLGMQRRLPQPLAFWTANFHAVVDADACTGCGTCATRCQVDAVAVRDAVARTTAAEQSVGKSTGKSGGTAVIDINRCIGCGVCTTTCAAEAIRLEKNDAERIPPADEEELYDTIRSGRKGWRETKKDVMRRMQGK
jgi:NAD-dependent dihydropyrimidine dehydrogenase PreA subunit